jgi:hypothetical protein
MLKGKFSRSVENSSEDGLYKFIVVLRISECNFSRLWRLSGTFLFGNVRTLPAVWTIRDLNPGASKTLYHPNTGPETHPPSSTMIPGLFTGDEAAGA